MALDLHLSVTAQERPDSRLALDYRGPHADSVPLDGSNLICRAMRSGLAVGDDALPGLDLRIVSEIPIGVGLGSSAAAIVAGLLLAGRLSQSPLSLDECLDRAAAMEGHPDNVAAALLGGFVVAASTSAGVLTQRVAVAPDLRFVVVTPERGLATSVSRGALPASYDREDVVWNLQRVALLTAAMFSGGSGLRPELVEDRLHQRQRAALMPGLDRCLEVRHPDLLGVFLSGAGSSVVAVARGSLQVIATLLERALASAGVAAAVRVLTADNQGAFRKLEDSGP